MAATQETSRTSRILVVDDDPIAAESLADFLSEEGHKASFVLSGEEAIAALSESQTGKVGESRVPIAVLITDISMPGLSGIDLLKRVTKEHPGVAVLTLTGYGTIESAVEAVRLSPQALSGIRC